MRDHSPLTLEKFRGLWRRGDPDNTPLDHFSDVNNLKVVGDDWATRYGVDIAQNVASPLGDIKRIYNYPTTTANTYLVLIKDGSNGKIYHIVNATTVYGPILTVAGMTDFAFVPYAGRAYISPFGSFDTGDINIQKGLQNEKVYVYKGDGTTARAAAGAIPTAGSLTIANGTGATDAGLHLFAVIYEYDTGYLTAPARFTQFATGAANGVSFSNIPTGGANVSKRHLVATKVIPSYNGNTTGYQYFFIPDGTINDNVTTVLNNVSFYDADLLDDASHLLDNYTEIPAGAVLTIYNERLVVAATYTDISLALISAKGEPESISQIDGLVIVPLDGNPITNAQEIRDVLYFFKRSKTWAVVDSGEEPSNWESPTAIDYALGTSVHGVTTVLDSGSASVDYLIVCTYAGIQLFTGRYVQPELTFKIQDLWFEQNRNLFKRIQIVNVPTQKEIYCVLTDGRLLVGNYAEGLDPKNIKWTIYSFNGYLSCIGVVNIDEIILGMELIA